MSSCAIDMLAALRAEADAADASLRPTVDEERAVIPNPRDGEFSVAVFFRVRDCQRYCVSLKRLMSDRRGRGVFQSRSQKLVHPH